MRLNGGTAGKAGTVTESVAHDKVATGNEFENVKIICLLFESLISAPRVGTVNPKVLLVAIIVSSHTTVISYASFE